jgi:hypothetical protein
MDRALLVGINAYPGAPLSGCVNDVAMMRALLQGPGGFGEDGRIQMLTDRAATTEAIRDGLRALILGAAAGDLLVFAYSGHGTQVRDQNHDEVDALDEVICPVDWDGTRAHMITDDDLAVLTRVPRGVNLTVILDSCHSGTMLRALPGAQGGHPSVPARPRAYPMRAAAFQALAAPARRGWRSWLRMAPAIRRLGSGLAATTQSAVLISATTAAQLAADAYLDGGYHGAHTYALDRVFRAHPSASYRQLARGMRTWLTQHGFGDQTPQLQGWSAARNRPAFRPWS